MTEKRFEYHHQNVSFDRLIHCIFDKETQKDYSEETLSDLKDFLNDIVEENQQLKLLTKPVQDTIIEEFTITKEDLSNNQRITELTNYALTEFIKSKGYTLKEVNQFIKEEL